MFEARHAGPPLPALFDALLVGGVIAFFAAAALSAWRDHLMRAEADAAFAEARRAAASVERHYIERGRLPASLARAGYEPPSPLPPPIETLRLLDSRGIVAVELKWSEALHGSIELAPVRGPDRVIRWRCASPDLASRYLPLACRPGAAAQSIPS